MRNTLVQAVLSKFLKMKQIAQVARKSHKKLLSRRFSLERLMFPLSAAEETITLLFL